MEAGALRHRINFESATWTRQSNGQSTAAWSTLLEKVPAAFEPEKGLEHFEAQGLVVTEPARFRIRYLPDITPALRIAFRDKVWDISAIVDVAGRERELHLYCGTGLTEG